MADQFLSQEEVDALLEGVNGDAGGSGPEEQAGGERPYDLAKQERIVRGRMPTLEIVNEPTGWMCEAAYFAHIEIAERSGP